MASLVFEPLMPAAAWAALMAAAVVLCGVYAWYRPPGLPVWRWATIVGLMSLGLAAVFVVLANPIRIDPLVVAGRPRLTVLIDTSASMSTDDVAGQGTRWKAALQFVGQSLPTWERDFDVRMERFADRMATVAASELETIEPLGPTTDLTAAIEASLRDPQASGQAVVLVTDGIHNTDSSPTSVLRAAMLARALDTPIYTRTFGTDVARFDLSVELAVPQQVVFAGQTTSVLVHARRLGNSPNVATLRLLADGKERESRQVRFDAEGRADAVFALTEDAAGLFRYDFEVDPSPRESVLSNNRALLVLRVLDHPMRVLFIEGKPYWDSKFLHRVLAFDPAIEVDSVVQLAPGRLFCRTLRHVRPGDEGSAGDADGAGAAPPKSSGPVVTDGWHVSSDAASWLADRAKLADYQVLVVGRDAEAFFANPAVDVLKKWIAADGAALVCYRGQPTARGGGALAGLLPVRWKPKHETRFRVDWTERGRSLHWLAEAGGGAPSESLAVLPSLALTGTAEPASPLAVVLAAAQNGPDANVGPAVSYQPYGAGRSVVVEGAGMWRWAFLPPQFKQHDHVYAALWQSLMRWLITSAPLLPGEDIALRVDKATFRTDEPAAGSLLMRMPPADGRPPEVVLSGEGLDEPRHFNGTPVADAEGVFRLVFGPLPEGRYEIQLVPPAAEGHRISFDVRRLQLEQLDARARPDLMQRLADATGGAALDGEDDRAIGRLFRARLERSREGDVRRTPLWDRSWVLLTILGTWAAAWTLRRQQGLI